MTEAGTMLHLAMRSVANRRSTLVLTVLSIAISVALLVGVERIRQEARAGFASTISGTDLIVGGRTAPLQLLLSSVFRIGDATNSVAWSSYSEIASSPLVAWSIPLSLGDSHRGFRVLGTTSDYFAHYRFAGNRTLAFDDGVAFGETFNAVLGIDVAQELGYRVGASITLSHGVGATSFAQHADEFLVAGILARTGTPVDRTVHVPLEGIAAIHEGWERGAAPRRNALAEASGHSDHSDHDHDPEKITAFLLGLNNRTDTLRLQRALNEYPREPLLAIIPGVALQQLWDLTGVVETALLAISACVIAAGLIGLLAAILTSLNERRREMAILRAVGARPSRISALLLLEAGLIALVGATVGVALITGTLVLGRDLIESRLGIFVDAPWPGVFELTVICVVVVAAMLLAIWPAWRAYRNALADGLTVRY